MNWPAVILAFISMFIFGLSDNLRGPLYPEILIQFGVNHSEASLFFSVGSFVSFLGAWLAPLVIARVGHVNTLRAGLVMIVVSYGAFAFAPNFSVLIAFSLLFGVAIGFLGVVQNLLVLLGSSASGRRRAQSALHGFYAVSSLLAPLVVLIFAGGGLHWQLNFLVPAVLAAVVIVGSAFTAQLKRPLRAPVRVTPHESASLEVSTGTAVERFYWAVVLAFYVALEILMSSRLAVFLREGRGFDLESSSFWLMSFFGGLLAGRVFFALVHLPFQMHRQMLGLTLVAGASFAAGLWIRPELMCLVGFAIAGLYPLWMSSCEPLFGAKMESVVARGIGLTGFSVVAMHSLVGFFSDSRGLTAGMSVGLFLLAGLFLMIAGFPLIFRRSLP